MWDVVCPPRFNPVPSPSVGLESVVQGVVVPPVRLDPFVVPPPPKSRLRTITLPFMLCVAPHPPVPRFERVLGQRHGLGQGVECDVGVAINLPDTSALTTVIPKLYALPKCHCDSLTTVTTVTLVSPVGTEKGVDDQSTTTIWDAIDLTAASTTTSAVSLLWHATRNAKVGAHILYIAEKAFNRNTLILSNKKHKGGCKHNPRNATCKRSRSGSQFQK